MSTSIENETLLVSLIGIDPRNRNAIEMVFNKEQCGICVLANADEAALTIVDLDKYGASDEWAALKLIKPDQLAIFLSINEANRNSSHLFIKKPVEITELVIALHDARSKLGSSVLSDLKKQSSWSRLFLPRMKKAVEKSSNIKNIPASENASKEISFISEAGYLIDEVKRAVIQANSEGYGIKLQLSNQGSIFIDPTEHWVNTDFVPEVLKDICQYSLNEAEVEKRVFSDGEFSKYLEEWRETKLKPIDIDSFLWDLALWTYRGSLPVNTDLNNKIIITYWPDLPRLTPVPNAMRIASLWVSCPMTLRETIDVLKIPQQDVFNFYVATFTLGLVRQSDQADNESKSGKLYKPVVKSEKNQREFYLRILKHLKGHDLDE